MKGKKKRQTEEEVANGEEHKRVAEREPEQTSSEASKVIGSNTVKDLTLKAPITTAADDIHKYFFIVFQRKYDLMFQVNPLLGRGFT